MRVDALPVGTFYQFSDITGGRKERYSIPGIKDDTAGLSYIQNIKRVENAESYGICASFTT
jgi:hypothetical protein